MAIPIRETFPTDRDDLRVQVTDDGSLTLVKTGGDDAFHSGCGAASETRHVYLGNSSVANRLCERQPTDVLEIGLGTSMAMLMTVDLAITHDASLTYVAVETDCITARTLKYLKPHQWVSNPEIVDAYLAFRQSLPDRMPPGTYTWRPDARRSIDIECLDARDWVNPSGRYFDAIYYDPFCPESAPTLWTRTCFKAMRNVIKDSGRLTTYSCSRPVRTALEQAHWHVDRVPGPVGGKREVIIALPGNLADHSSQQR